MSSRFVLQKKYTPEALGFNGVTATAADGEWLDVSGYDSITFFIGSSAASTVTLSLDTSPDDGTNLGPYKVATDGGAGAVTYDNYVGTLTIAGANEVAAAMFDIKDHSLIRIANLTVSAGVATTWATASTQ